MLELTETQNTIIHFQFQTNLLTLNSSMKYQQVQKKTHAKHGSKHKQLEL